MRRSKPFILGLVGLLAGACSLLNREGPDVTCADLANGAENACADGIIATCVNGAVRYKVCPAKSACSAPWQTSGRYRCTETEPAPNLVGSVPDDDGEGGVLPDGANPDGAGNGGTDASSATCAPPAGESCGPGQGRRYCTDGRTWTECLVENSNCIEHKSGGWPSFADTAGGACSGEASGALVACKACEGSVVCGGPNTCARPASATTVGCGKPGTVVKEPNTGFGQTYCLQGGSFMNRGAASGREITSGEVIPCGAGGKPPDDVETCTGGAGSAEVCESCNGMTWVRVCRTTGKWSGCNQGTL